MAAPYSQNYDGEVTREFTRGPATLPCFPMYNAQYEWKSCLNGDGRCGSSAPPRKAKCSSLSSQTATSQYIQRHTRLRGSAWFRRPPPFLNTLGCALRAKPGKFLDTLL